jgi:thiosulfate/3-mercaptopyruvate sulfurtransferase
VREVAVIDADGLSDNLAKSQVLVLDARSAGRFQGVEPEPRPGMRSGHIPGSVNIPFKMLLDSEARRLLPKETLTEIFKTAGVDRQPLVVTCGSGVTACVLALGLEICGLPAPKLFDGSWSEWAIREDLPVEMD